MALSARRSHNITNFWPSYVDALSTVLMVITFLLMIFVLAQFFLTKTLSGRDQALHQLEGQVNQLSQLLSLERSQSADLRLNVAQLSQQLQASVAQRDDLQSTLKALTLRAEGAEADTKHLNQELENAFKTILADKATVQTQVDKLAALTEQVAALQALKKELENQVAGMSGKLQKSESALMAERDISQSARAQVALLNEQMAALRQQLGALSKALDVSEKLSADQKVQIASLGSRLNAALATKVQELSRYRSEFFGRLRKILGNRPGIRIVGDRFVFQSEVLFPTASADLEDSGKAQLVQLADTLKELAPRIPKDINWVLRVDGHTDSRPINTPQFPSNWELSTARAISVVKFLIDQGIPPNRLVAAGFGPYDPIDPRNDEIAYRRNRRIEFKLTEP